MIEKKAVKVSCLNPADLKKDNAELYKAPAGEPLAADIRSSETQEARRRAVLEKLAARQALRKEEAAKKKEVQNLFNTYKYINMIE